MCRPNFTAEENKDDKETYDIFIEDSTLDELEDSLDEQEDSSLEDYFNAIGNREKDIQDYINEYNDWLSVGKENLHQIKDEDKTHERAKDMILYEDKPEAKKLWAYFEIGHDQNSQDAEKEFDENSVKFGYDKATIKNAKEKWAYFEIGHDQNSQEAEKVFDEIDVKFGYDKATINNVKKIQACSEISPDQNSQEAEKEFDENSLKLVHDKATINNGKENWFSIINSNDYLDFFKDPVGLKNMGATCYMNAILQCLVNLFGKPGTKQSVTKDFFETEINTTTSKTKGNLIRSFGKLVEEIWESKDAVTPADFKNTFDEYTKDFEGVFMQHDAQEFLASLLQGLHEDVNRVVAKPTEALPEVEESLSDQEKGEEAWRRYLLTDDSRFVDMFAGQQMSTLTCKTCGHRSVSFEPFWSLSLPVIDWPVDIELKHCLDSYFDEEILEEDDRPFCSKCESKEPSTKKLSISRFPEVLVFHLKRFTHYGDKIETSVTFPYWYLELMEYEMAESKREKTSVVYELSSLSEHTGYMFEGHHTALCYTKKRYRWFKFDDDRVEHLEIAHHKYISPYLLFYVRRDSKYITDFSNND